METVLVCTTSLHDACHGGNLQRAVTLLLAGADINARRGSYNYTPLNYANGRGNLDIVRHLLEW